MTEDRTDPRTDRADRAERALRAAFAEQTDGLDARPAAGRWVEEARRTARPRRPLVAAAAAVVLLGGSLLALEVALPERGADPDPAPDAAAPWEDPPRVDGVVQVRDGWRWVERGTVGVQVPVEWVDESLTCGGAWDGGPPAVASVGTHDYAVSADCMVPPGRDPLVADPVTDEAFPPYPPEMWRTILIIEDEATVYEGGDSAVQVPDGTYTYDGWTLRRVTHGGTRVSLLSDTAHEDVALEVLGSLVVGDVTPAGCRATEEFGQERDQALPPDRAVLAATVCGYEPILQNLGAPPVHRLEVSRSLDEGEAAALLSALRVAPALPAVPDPCAHRDAVSYVQLLRFFVDGAVSESEVAVYDCAVEVDGTWRVLTDEVASHLAGRITW